MRAVIRRVTDNFIELREEIDRILRHLNIDGSRELRAHTAHALAGRALTLVRLPLHHQHVATATVRQVPGNARPDDSPADNDDIRRLRHIGISPHKNAAVTAEFGTNGPEKEFLRPTPVTLRGFHRLMVSTR